MSNNNAKCDPKCYTGGKGCILSENGQCLYIFENGKKNQPYKSEKTYYTPVKKWDNLQYKGVKIELDSKPDLIISNRAFVDAYLEILDELSKTKNSI